MQKQQPHPDNVASPWRPIGCLYKVLPGFHEAMATVGWRNDPIRSSCAAAGRASNGGGAFFNQLELLHQFFNSAVTLVVRLRLGRRHSPKTRQAKHFHLLPLELLKFCLQTLCSRLSIGRTGMSHPRSSTPVPTLRVRDSLGCDSGHTTEQEIARLLFAERAAQGLFIPPM